MSEIPLKRLRELRGRAKLLLGNVLTDLSPFAKQDGTFRRKPDSVSPAGDVNVTTTCSCLMALALTNNFREFYKKDAKIESVANDVFTKLVKAPWMSSGLNGNNAFTTTLVLRTFGFLVEEGLFGIEPNKPDFKQKECTKEWELYSGIKDVLGLARKLKESNDSATKYLWLSLLDVTRNRINTFLSSDLVGDEAELAKKKLKSALALDLQRILQGGWIYHEGVFDKASAATKRTLGRNPTGYKLTSANHSILADQFPSEIEKPKRRSLKEIADLISRESDGFSINEYSPSAAVLYWFVDGVARAQIALPEKNWTAICLWAAKEFNHERSLVVAGHDAMMDPIAMGMAACLCSRLRTIGADSSKENLGTTKDHLSMLPSLVELECSVEELILKQTKSGIWNKYFPLFHYQDAGSNFCFTFELLEAILYEFGGNDNRLLENPIFIEGLEKAVKWCENNRQKCSENDQEYFGWNSGGYIETLEKGQPESWATAVVHMFLWELTGVFSKRIQQQVLKKYKERSPKKIVNPSSSIKKASVAALDNLMDIGLWLRDEPVKLSTILKLRIIDDYKKQNESTLRRTPIKKPLSALLFGPPGTSKTEVTKAIADDLGWPMLEINPSDFVRGTLANVYLQADEIFDDLMDLSGVVVFFDEMDALVQTREGEGTLDITSQFLTTTMLPKLTKLHDQAHVVFFMATNYQDRFDSAIKRAGRFDLLLCMGPPTLDEKLDRLHKAYFLDDATNETINAGKLIRKYLKARPMLQDQLALYTFGEYKAFLKSIGNESTIGAKIRDLKQSGFIKALNAYSKYITLKISDLDALKKIGIKWKRISDLDNQKFTLKQIERKNLQKTNVIRYFCDRKETKEQY
jgi:hypothetical protein